MSVTSDLLQTTSGIKLWPEIILNVAEELIASEPEGINNLLHTSKVDIDLPLCTIDRADHTCTVAVYFTQDL